MSNFLKFISYIYNESFINKIFSTISDLYNESYLNKLFQKIKTLYFDSFIYSVLIKEEDKINMKFNFSLIKYEGTIESIIIFISVFGIFFSLNISDLIIKLLMLIFLYFILFFTIFDKETLRSSFIYKIISRSIDG